MCRARGTDFVCGDKGVTRKLRTWRGTRIAKNDADTMSGFNKYFDHARYFRFDLIFDLILSPPLKNRPPVLYVTFVKIHLIHTRRPHSRPNEIRFLRFTAGVIDAGKFARVSYTPPRRLIRVWSPKENGKRTTRKAV